ncbi:unnamed protein product [Leptidea sinapis]|uniref:Ionotropic glutamate receptor C-terminal domain-containing protein n=1 Tax=Leptidea sinapis TaxID=189913 RepID=A0A5E4QAU2_9NEOP|nr:unnamed protein product [Leptidea sinapis]
MLKEISPRKDLQHVVIDLLNGIASRNDVTCVALITDAVYLGMFEGALYKRTYTMPFVTKEGCNVYSIILANGLQVTRLLKFGDRQRLLDTRAKFIILHDIRLFHSDLHYLWKRIVNVLFIKSHRKIHGVLKSKPWFDLSTVPFPNPIKQILVPRRVDIWRNGKFHYGRKLFDDKTKNLNGEVLDVVYLEHTPSVVILNTLAHKMNFKPKLYQPINGEITKWGEKQSNGSFSGLLGEMVNGKADIALGNLQYVPYNLELVDLSLPLYMWVAVLLVLLVTGSIFHGLAYYHNNLIKYRKDTVILNTLAHKMNFKPKLYQPINGEITKWGEKQPNGSFSGLLGEMVNGKADIALGNLQYVPYNLELVDLSLPYTSQCWTFLTQEALTDDSWKTLILPFKLYMWVAVLLVLLVTGSIFHGLAYYHNNLIKYRKDTVVLSKPKPVGLYLFDEITNSILYTYGMLLVVSLPKLPSGWSIRLLTGWYWLYCILLVVSYRASMTAILANPAPRVTIDTLQELVDSKLRCGGWGSETKKFFQQSLDENGQIIGEKFEMIDNPDEAVRRVAQGAFAYYDNSNFLKYLSVKRKKVEFNKIYNSTENDTDLTNRTYTDNELHIMTNCVVNAPISIGFHKNSPLKPLADRYLQQIVEVGLVVKWLNDAMYLIRSLDSSKDEIKALMNLQKMYCAFIALAIGYIISVICLIGEYLHWNLIVKRDPKFDKYHIDQYFKKN